jgi:hypothetical protein
LRHLVPLLIVLCAAGCAAAPHASFELGNLAGHGRRVLLKAAEVQLCEMHFGPECVPRPEWIATAEPLLQQVLAAELADHGAEVVTDPNAAADYILTVNLKDHFASSGLVAGRAAMFTLLVPLFLLMDGPEGLDDIVSSGPTDGTGPPPSPYGPLASASLEDFSSHELVWQVVYTSGIADVRSADGATQTSRLLLKEFPWSR